MKEESSKTPKHEPLPEPKKEINAWVLSYRFPEYREFPEWKYGIRFIYWDWK